MAFGDCKAEARVTMALKHYLFQNVASSDGEEPWKQGLDALLRN
jgi:hypothetical protein